MKRFIKPPRARALIPFLALAALAFGQLEPNAPITNFKLPLFNESGYRSWYLKGNEGLYVAGGKEVQIKDMVLQEYSGDARDEVIGQITSPSARFQIKPRIASGPGSIHVDNNLFSLDGEDWIWQGQQNALTINRRVKVVIQGEIGDLIQ